MFYLCINFPRKKTHRSSQLSYVNFNKIFHFRAVKVVFMLMHCHLI